MQANTLHDHKKDNGKSTLSEKMQAQADDIKMCRVNANRKNEYGSSVRDQVVAPVKCYQLVVFVLLCRRICITELDV